MNTPLVRRGRTVWLVALGALASACAGSEGAANNGPAKGSASDSATVTMLPPVARPRVAAPGDSSCPRNGLWQPCALVDRMVHAGLSFKPTGDTVRVSFLEPAGIQYRVALTDTMVAYFFVDSAALARAVAPLDTIRMAPASDTTMPWQARPIVIRSGNMLALYFAASARQIERIRLAITAGAPAP